MRTKIKFTEDYIKGIVNGVMVVTAIPLMEKIGKETVLIHMMSLEKYEHLTYSCLNAWIK